ncbi:MAG: SRPBCC domain-containing protein [bacterium]|nr:SRPBCC domain-containing protein [bacterium]
MTITVDFTEQGEGTLVCLIHAGIPDMRGAESKI